MTLGLIGIVISLVVLITLAYRGMSVILAAPIAALVAMVLSGVPLLATYTEIFMPAMAGFVASYFPIFLTGAIFGALMTYSGYATDLANIITKWVGPKRAMLATTLTAAVMTYGGISVFVAVFVMFPLARELFRAANLPRRLIPAAIANGTLTFTMTALPGSPQVQNIIPGQFFQTSTFAAPGLGLLGGTIIFAVGMLWLEFRKRQLLKKGESFTDLTKLEEEHGRDADLGMSSGPAGSTGETAPDDETTVRSARSSDTSRSTQSAPSSTLTQLRPRNHIYPFIPLLLVFAVNFGCTVLIFPAMDWSTLDDEQFGGVTLEDRASIWAVLIALLVAILSILILNARNLRGLWQAIAHGTTNSMRPIFSTASEVGYGGVIASVGAFAIVRDGMFGISENALVTSAVSTSVISGITGSASGGMTIALNALGDDFRQLAVEQSISMEAMHRITAMASGGLDSMPHNGAVITLLLVCGLTHRESYKDVGMITLVIPVAVTALLIPFIMVVGSF